MNIFRHQTQMFRILCKKYHIASDSTKHYTIRMLEPHNGTNSTLLLQTTNLLLENNR
jgi:hypothetical protein